MTEREAIEQNTLFKGLDEAQRKSAMAFFDARRTQYRRGATLIRTGDPMHRFALVLHGCAQVLQPEPGGNELIMHEAVPGETFGESLCFLGIEEAPIYVSAPGETVILWLSCDRVRAPQNTPFEVELRNRFITMLAQRTLDMNRRIQVLTRHTLREKLLMLLSQHTRQGGTVTLPFSRTDLAAYLGTHRSSLTRELSRMEQDGLIHIDRRKITLLNEATDKP